MITQAESQFRGRISSILQVFIEAAVTEICELIELEVATLRSELTCHSERGSNVTRGKLTLQSTEENISSGNEHGFASPEHNDILPHNTAGRGLTERKIFRNQGRSSGRNADSLSLAFFPLLTKRHSVDQLATSALLV